MPDNNYRNQNDGCMDWGDTIEQDNQFVILPEGDYTFTVTKFERARHAGSEKIPPCNKALLTLEVKTKDGTATVLTDLHKQDFPGSRAEPRRFCRTICGIFGN